MGPSGWFVPALQEGCYTRTMNEGFFTPPQGLCGLWHQGGRATSVRERQRPDWTGIPGPGCNGAWRQAQQRPSVLEGWPRGWSWGTGQLGRSRASPGSTALHAGPPCVWAEGPTAPPAESPGSLPCSESCWGRGRGVPKAHRESEKQEGKEVERRVRHEGSHSLRMKLSSLVPGGIIVLFAFCRRNFSWPAPPGSPAHLTRNPLLSSTHTPQCSTNVY